MADVTSNDEALSDLARRIQSELARPARARGPGHAPQVGFLLLEARALLSPAEWKRWLKQHARLSPAEAAAYVRAARGWPLRQARSLEEQGQDPGEGLAHRPRRGVCASCAAVTILTPGPGGGRWLCGSCRRRVEEELGEASRRLTGELGAGEGPEGMVKGG